MSFPFDIISSFWLCFFLHTCFVIFLRDVAALKTSRQVTPSLIDVSSSNTFRQLSRTDVSLADRPIPCPQTTAHPRQALIDVEDAVIYNPYIATLTPAYITIDFRKVERVLPRCLLVVLPPIDLARRSDLLLIEAKTGPC